MLNFSLQPFTSEDLSRLLSWLKTEKELIQFAGPFFTHPLTIQQLEVYLEEEDKTPFKVVLEETQEVVGHCELNFEEDQPLLSRILIGDERLRGKGLGKRIVFEMSQRLFEAADTDAIYLYVFAWNKQALSCYQKVGFEAVPSKTTYVDVQDETWERLKMKLTRKRFEQH